MHNDPDLNNYLEVFMNVVTFSYRKAELVNSKEFQLVEKGDSVIIKSVIDLLELVPYAGPLLKTIAKVAHK